MDNTTKAMEDWLRMHRSVVERDLAFTDLLIEAIDGKVSQERLRKEHALLVAERELCAEVYAQAFPDTRPEPPQES